MGSVAPTEIITPRVPNLGDAVTPCTRSQNLDGGVWPVLILHPSTHLVPSPPHQAGMRVVVLGQKVLLLVVGSPLTTTQNHIQEEFSIVQPFNW